MNTHTQKSLGECEKQPSTFVLTVYICFFFIINILFYVISFHSIVSMLDVLPSLFISLLLSGQYKVLQPGNPEVKVSILSEFI